MSHLIMRVIVNAVNFKCYMMMNTTRKMEKSLLQEHVVTGKKEWLQTGHAFR